MEKQLLIIIPVYNEEESIGKLIEELKREHIDDIGDILVINDGSTDNTKDIVKHHNIDILNKPINMGYGSTLQLGYKYASRNAYKYIIQMDGDGQHDVSNINIIYDLLKKKDCESERCPDIVIGSRFLGEKNEMHVSWLKMSAILFFKQIIKLFTNKDITDPTSGLQGLNKDAFDFYAIYGNFDYKYPDINMIIQMLMMGYKIEEVPAHMHSRKAGEGMHHGVLKPVFYMIIMSLSIINIIIRQRKNYYKLRKNKVNGEIDNGQKI